jgi:hypothetical protein
VVVAHVEHAPRVTEGDKVPAGDGTAVVVGPDMCAGLAVAEARVGADLAVGGVGGGGEDFVVVEDGYGGHLCELSGN